METLRRGSFPAMEELGCWRLMGDQHEGGEAGPGRGPWKDESVCPGLEKLPGATSRKGHTALPTVQRKALEILGPPSCGSQPE